MTVFEIKQAIKNGKRVFWRSFFYEVEEFTRNNFTEWYITFRPSQLTMGLCLKDGVTLNGIESDFYIGEEHHGTNY